MNDEEYPGIGRLNYFLANVAMGAVVAFVAIVFTPGSRVMTITMLVVMIASMMLDVMRLRNMGVSQWFAFLRILPFGKMLLTTALTCAQTGWIETRRLDSPGKSILLVELLFLALIIFLVYWIRVSVPMVF